MTYHAAVRSESQSSNIDYVRSAWTILAEGAGSVAQDLLNISHNSKNDLARVRAAEAVLSRVGLPEQVDVGITARQLVGTQQQQESTGAVDMVKARLAQIRAQQLAAEAGGVVVQFPHAVNGPDIEGEVEEDD